MGARISKGRGTFLGGDTWSLKNAIYSIYSTYSTVFASSRSAVAFCYHYYSKLLNSLSYKIKQKTLQYNTFLELTLNKTQQAQSNHARLVCQQEPCINRLL